MTISQVASAAGIPTTTLRYYERCGLIMPLSRNGSNYRLYGPETLRKLRFLRTAQAVGFALDDIATLLRLENAEGRCCQAQVRELLEKRLAGTEQRLEELVRVKAALRRALRRCKSSGESCAVMLDLKSGADGASKRRKRGQPGNAGTVPRVRG